MSNQDRYSKYAGDSERENEASSYKNWAIAKLIGGFIAILIGLALTVDSTYAVYYGAVWLGVDLMLDGLLNLYLRKSDEEMNFGIKILIRVASLTITAILLMAFGVDLTDLRF